MNASLVLIALAALAALLLGILARRGKKMGIEHWAGAASAGSSSSCY
jgi:hypothetical protein